MLAPYDDTWPAQFRSTAVPGLLAKPIIDLAVRVEELADVEPHRDAPVSSGSSAIGREHQPVMLTAHDPSPRHPPFTTPASRTLTCRRRHQSTGRPVLTCMDGPRRLGRGPVPRAVFPWSMCGTSDLIGPAPELPVHRPVRKAERSPGRPMRRIGWGGETRCLRSHAADAHAARRCRSARDRCPRARRLR